jgi:alpha-D-xyloside xylohydrolase
MVKLSKRSLLKGISLLPLLAAAGWAAPCSPAVTDVKAAGTSLTVQSGCGATLIEPWSENVLRVRRLPAGASEPRPSLIVNGKKAPATFAVSQTGDEIVATTASLKITVTRKDGHIAFYKPGEAKPFVSEARDEAAPSKAGLYRITQSFSVPFGAGLHYYGLGQHPAGGLDWQKQGVHLQQANGDTGLPMLLTSGGWGVLWDNASVTDVSVQRPAEGGNLQFASEAAQAVDYYLIAGANADTIIAGYRKLTGESPMLPRWAWGFWQSYEHYATQDEIVGIAKRYRDSGIPIDGIIQDWQYWPDHQWGSHLFDAKRYPDPKKMVADIHALDIHTIISVWPRFDKGLANTQELDAAGALFPKNFIPNVYPPGQGRWYDPYGIGRNVYWSQISRTLGKAGFDGWWLDGSEAELSGDWGEMRDVETAKGPGALVYNAYPLYHTTGVFEGHRRDFPDRRPVILTRSAWAGQQRNGAISWSGDIHGDWETFRRQIPAGLNFVAAGLPYWNTDIGGFFAGDPKDPAYGELFTRWFEFGAFTPMFRVHGTGKSKEMWQFNADVQPILLKYDRLRYRLLPYIYSLAWQVTSRSGSMMRPLVFDFGADPDALDIGDQYMFGPAMMVAPVVRKGAADRTVYLPGGGDWYDFWTGKRMKAKATIVSHAPLDTLPLFVRAGSVLPMGPVVGHADAQQDKPIELRIYPGADGSFTLYDDSGNGWGYEKGERATVDIAWNDAAHTLTFTARQGKFPGMRKAREFRVVLVGEGAGSGDGEAVHFQTVRYTGRKLTIQVPG